jgi:hypothetical protein
MNIDYQSDGTVIAAHKLQPIRDNHRYIILVNTGSTPQPWCVSKYENGSPSRGSGTYFREHADALKEFTKQVTDAFGTL